MARKPASQPADGAQALDEPYPHDAPDPGAEVCRLRLGENPPGQWLVLTTLALLALGTVMVHSALASVARLPAAWYQRVDMRHTLFAGLAAGVLILAWRIDYRVLLRGRNRPVLPTIALAAALVLAAMVHIPGVGIRRNGALRWLGVTIGSARLSFQPSELVKVALVVFLATWMTRPGAPVRSARRFLWATAIIALSVGLVVKEDFGSGMIIALCACVTLWLARVPLVYLLSYVVPVAAGFYALVMRNPQRWRRITAMLDPWSTANASAYHARQSLIATLSGGWTGAGLGNGTRKLGYLPEDSTDFIFAVYCEEWGFVGAMLLIGLMVIWIWCARRIALRAADRFGQVLAGALGFAIALQMVLHVAVDPVAAPPTGMGLPFVSAGGTALMLMAGAAAVLVSVSAHRPADEVVEADE